MRRFISCVFVSAALILSLLWLPSNSSAFLNSCDPDRLVGKYYTCSTDQEDFALQFLSSTNGGWKFSADFRSFDFLSQSFVGTCFCRGRDFQCLGGSIVSQYSQPCAVQQPVTPIAIVGKPWWFGKRIKSGQALIQYLDPDYIQQPTYQTYMSSTTEVVPFSCKVDRSIRR